MQPYEILAGDIIFNEGDDGEYACIIRSGHVQILKRATHGEVELAVLGEGEVFGEMALFEPRDARSATARALDHVIVDVLSADEMHELIGQAPNMLQPFIGALVSRLRENNRRLAEKERATVLLGHAINMITIQPCGALEGLVKPVSVKTANLPFTIGGYANNIKPPHVNHLEIPCDPLAMNISYEHCVIEQHDDDVFLIDKGSRFRTIVNERSIGRGEATSKALLMPGDNTVTLGQSDKDMLLRLICE